jgi:hypothetical protein
MGLFKNIRITERWIAQLRGEFFNTFNHTNLTNSSNNFPTLSVNSGGFGTITNAYGSVISDPFGPRVIQLALKLTF